MADTPLVDTLTFILSSILEQSFRACSVSEYTLHWVFIPQQCGKWLMTHFFKNKHTYHKYMRQNVLKIWMVRAFWGKGATRVSSLRKGSEDNFLLGRWWMSTAFTFWSRPMLPFKLNEFCAFLVLGSLCLGVYLGYFKHPGSYAYCLTNHKLLWSFSFGTGVGIKELRIE